MRLTESVRVSALLIALVLAASGCRKSVEPPEQDPPTSQPSASAAPAIPSASAAAAVVDSSASAQSALAASQPNASSSAQQSAPSAAQPDLAHAAADPMGGNFTLKDATKGLAPTGKLVADIITDDGKLSCELFDDKAPITVANFVGLARGLRPFKDPKTSQWVKRPGYDGTGFHRIIKGFMIQGGDPAGTGAGEPGYVFKDEVWPGATHDRRGLLCMANRGPNTNGMQFFILDAPAKHLDRSYTIFGSCGPDSVIEKLAGSEVRGDRAINPPKIKKVTIRRGK